MQEPEDCGPSAPLHREAELLARGWLTGLAIGGEIPGPAVDSVDPSAGDGPLALTSLVLGPWCWT